MVKTTPLLPYENQIIAALASGSVTQAAIQLGIEDGSDLLLFIADKVPALGQIAALIDEVRALLIGHADRGAQMIAQRNREADGCGEHQRAGDPRAGHHPHIQRPQLTKPRDTPKTLAVSQVVKMTTFLL